jgi:hypothetical protein
MQKRGSPPMQGPLNFVFKRDPGIGSQNKVIHYSDSVKSAFLEIFSQMFPKP